MANTYVTIASNSIMSGAPGATVVADEYLQIAPNVDVVGGGSDDGITLRSGTAAGGAINVQGYVAGYYGVSLRYQTGNETISVGPAGSIVGQDDGVYLQSQPTGYVQRLDNEGYIYGATNGVSLGDDDAQIENAGTIDAGYVAVFDAGNSDTVTNDTGGHIASDGGVIQARGTGFSLVNAGSISTSSSQDAAVSIDGSGGSVLSSGDIQGQTDVVVFNAGQDSLHNSGTISAGGSDAVFFGGGGDYFDNSGVISASAGVVEIFGSGNQTDWVVNEAGGVMEANPGSYNTVIYDPSDDMLHSINRGEMVGEVETYGDDSSFTNTGDYTGELDLEGGAELVRNAGKITFDGTSGILAAAFQTASTIVSGVNISINGADGYDDRLVNATGAVIDATGAIAIEHGGEGTFRFVNRGDIYGDIDLDGIASGVNAGTIGGDVNFYDDSGLFINRGLVDGNVTFTGTGNIYRGYLGEVTGTIYGAGADGRYFGGEGDDIFDMTASSAKIVVGGDGDDTFIFTASGLTANTVIRGGAGDDTLTFSTAGTIAASAFLNVRTIETINLAASGTNTLSAPDALVTSANGGSLTINGGSGVDNVNLSAVVNPSDTVTVNGGAGADNITVGGGTEVFAYGKVTDSTGTGTDTLKNVNFALDRFQISSFASPILAINTAVTTGNLSGSTFNSDLTTDLNGKLGAHDAVLFTASGGALTGQTYLVVDVNGTAGYQANADLVIHLTGQTGALTTANFI